MYRSYDPTSLHEHELFDVSSEAVVPSLAVTLTPDTDPGWNAKLHVENFRFAPEHAGAAHVMGEGHVHVEVDGVKIARWYGPWGHIPGLPPGEYELRFSLNTNDHREYANGVQPIESRMKVTVDDR